MPLRTDAGVKKWDEEALHFTACNTKRALWFLLSGKFPNHLRRRQLTGAEQSALEDENERLRELVGSLGGTPGAVRVCGTVPEGPEPCVCVWRLSTGAGRAIFERHYYYY